MRKGLGLSILVLGIAAVCAILISKHSPTAKAPDHRKEKQERPAAPPTGNSPPDQQAFYATYRIIDPEKKIEALEKFLQDFPDSSQIGSAKRGIFTATVKKWPGERKRIMEAAGKLIHPPAEPGAKTANVPENQFIATELLTAGILLDDAENFALKSLEDLNKERFTENMKKTYAEWKKTMPTKAMPSDEVVNERYIAERAAYKTTLGSIYMKEGKTTEGEKTLREAYEADPLLSPAAEGLAEIAEKKGDLAAALDYLVTATLTAGHGTKDTRSRFEALYRKAHKGSIQGIEATLDARYKKLFPNPIKAEPYKPSSSRSDRVVLAESFTGAG